MAKAPLITETDRTNIAMVFQQNPKERPEKVRLRVMELSKREIGLGTIQREMAKLRKAHKAGEDKDDRDAPWNIGSIAKYPIQTQHIPTMVQGSKLRQKKQNKRLTIRQAQWVDRLCDFDVNEDSKIQELQTQYDILVLGENNQNKEHRDELIKQLEILRSQRALIITNVAVIYSELERWSEIQGTTFDTSQFDDEYLELMTNKLFAYAETIVKKIEEGDNNG